MFFCSAFKSVENNLLPEGTCNSKSIGFHLNHLILILQEDVP